MFKVLRSMVVTKVKGTVVPLTLVMKSGVPRSAHKIIPHPTVLNVSASPFRGLQTPLAFEDKIKMSMRVLVGYF